MSLKFTFKNINTVASSNVKRQIVPIYSSRVFETTRQWNSSHVADGQQVLRGWAQITTSNIVITFSSGRLDGMSRAGAPAGGEQIPRVVAAPVVERAFPAVERDVDLVAVHRADSRRTQQMRVLPVDRLQLHADLEVVGLGRRRLLTANVLPRVGKNHKFLNQKIRFFYLNRIFFI